MRQFWATGTTVNPVTTGPFALAFSVVALCRKKKRKEIFSQYAFLVETVEYELFFKECVCVSEHYYVASINLVSFYGHRGSELLWRKKL